MAQPSALVVPIRSFANGSARLAKELDERERALLAQELAGRVLDARGTLEVVIVTSDPAARAWGERRGARVLDDPGSLDAAADSGRAWAAARAMPRVVIAHADLPFVHDLDELAEPGAAAVAVLVTDQHRDGTPLLSIPAAVEFGFAYGPGSFRRHIDAARHAGLTVDVRDDADLGFDVDEPADLEVMRARGRQ